MDLLLLKLLQHELVLLLLCLLLRHLLLLLHLLGIGLLCDAVSLALQFFHACLVFQVEFQVESTLENIFHGL